MSEYSAHFFDTLEKGSRRSAEIVVPLLIDLVRPASVVDVGCGRGTWLSVFRDHGIDDVLGLDGAYMAPESLDIPHDRFQAVDLGETFSISRRFDLVLCLEVAEHLPESHAETFLDCLTALGPVVAFSAAIPHQGGVHHVNEQWPDYWIKRFMDRGYRSFDPLRASIWAETEVEYWYAQNLLVFIHSTAVERFTRLMSMGGATAGPPSLVHPRRYLEMREEVEELRQEAEELRQEAEELQHEVEELRQEAEELRQHLEWASRPENMSLRTVIAALPTILAAAIRRRLEGSASGSTKPR
jgi:hypothetical protein